MLMVKRVFFLLLEGMVKKFSRGLGTLAPSKLHSYHLAVTPIFLPSTGHTFPPKIWIKISISTGYAINIERKIGIKILLPTPFR